MTRFSMPRRDPADLTPDEVAEAGELHDAAVRLLLDALTGPQTEVNP